jgi:L-threonylcarbamoyladenylate synthase
MEWLKVDTESPDPAAVRRAAAELKAGGLVIFPTETVYGLAADALNEDAVRLAYEAKGRPEGQPLPVQIADVEQLGLITARVPDVAAKLIEKYFPGPLTIVLPRSAVLPELVTAGRPSVGVRMPDHPVALALIRETGGPIIATSANISGKPEPKTADEAVGYLGRSVRVVLDAGPARIGSPSTVVDVTVTPPRIVRVGAVPVKELQDLIGEVLIDG